MADTALKGPKQLEEWHDPDHVLERKMLELQLLVQNSKHMVVFTGAGISTSAGMGDFRGPKGKWTLKAQGLEPLSGTPSIRALPTRAHMALVQLHRQGKLKYVVSTNCDGLHRRSGIPACAVSELHGNGNMEICEDCGLRYFRDFQCVRRGKGADHFTGRFCHQCSGRLLEYSIDFGQGLPPKPLQRAYEESAKADLHIVLGTSLRVEPSCSMPGVFARKGGKLVIVNLQQTPLDSKALKINATTDKVMELLMERLGIPIPLFRLERRFLIYQDGESVVARGVDVNDAEEETGVLCGVTWKGEPKPIPVSQRARAIWQHAVHQHLSCNLDLKSMCPTLHFVGHYQEPSITLDVDLTHGGKDVRIAFDPLACAWTIDKVACMEEVVQSRMDHDPEYGCSHRCYVVGKRRENGIPNPEEQVEEEFQRARLYAEACADMVPLQEYVATNDKVSVFESCQSSRTLRRRLDKGDIVAAVGAVCEVDGFKMLPIFPCGAVQLGFLRKVGEEAASEAGASASAG